MARYVLTVKIGKNGVGATIRDVDTGNVTSFFIPGPREIAEAIIKMLEASPEIEVKYE